MSLHMGSSDADNRWDLQPFRKQKNILGNFTNAASPAAAMKDLLQEDGPLHTHTQAFQH